MSMFTGEYLTRHFDGFDFFDPQCRDQRIREIQMRTKRCLACPGFQACQAHPEFWLKGHVERWAANQPANQPG